MRITKDIPYGPNGMHLDLYAPDQDGFDTLIWFHGGGFEAGSCRDAEPLTKPLLLIYNAEDIPCRPEQNLLMYQSIRHFQPDAPVFLKELPGGHCAGSTHKDENGNYPYVTALKEFLASLR